MIVHAENEQSMMLVSTHFRLDRKDMKSTIPAARRQETFMKKGPTTSNYKFCMRIMDTQQLRLACRRICVPTRLQSH